MCAIENYILLNNNFKTYKGVNDNRVEIKYIEQIRNEYIFYFSTFDMMNVMLPSKTFKKLDVFTLT
jgi:hypothetical protein